MVSKDIQPANERLKYMQLWNKWSSALGCLHNAEIPKSKGATAGFGISPSRRIFQAGIGVYFGRKHNMNISSRICENSKEFKIFEHSIKYFWG